MPDTIKYLGQDRRGFTYDLKDDDYVYMNDLFGRERGYLCTREAWERTFKKILIGGHVENTSSCNISGCSNF